MDRIFFSLFGGLFFGIGLWQFISERKFFKRAILVQGVVVDHASKRGSKGGTLYAPVVEFMFDEQRRRVTGSLYSNSKKKLGTLMQVGVNPQKTSEVRLKQKSSLILSIIFMLVGGVTFILGIPLLLGNF